MSKQLKYLKHDLFRYFYPNNETHKISLWKKIDILFTERAAWAICLYRIRKWSKYELKIPILRNIINFIGILLQPLIEIASGVFLLPTANIGPGLYIGHFGNIIIGETTIGKYCNISHENTFGFAGRGDKRGGPTIGDFVYIGPGAKIFGKIKIGNYVAIGANAVVTKDVPENAVVVGIPAKIISYKSSKDFIEFSIEKNREFLKEE